MKLETIKTAIKEWYIRNDFVNETQYLLNQGVFFKIDPKVKETNFAVTENQDVDIYIHAYPAIIQEELKFILINSEMDNQDKFEDKAHPITQYIYIADVIGMDSKLAAEFLNLKSTEPNTNEISPEEAKERILRWSLIKDEWAVNQINNTEGIFEVFVIPEIDLKDDSDIYAFLALTGDNTADLIIMDKQKNTYGFNNFIPNEEGLYDVVVPCPPFDEDEESNSIPPNSKIAKNNFYLLNYSIQ